MDNLTLARKLEKYYRSLGMPVPSDLLSIIDNNGVDIQKDYIQPKLVIPKAGGGNIVSPNIYNQNQFNEFNEGGLHETNPHGGVPIGNDSTVEQGETSMRTKDGQFIFSDRIDTLGNVLKPLPKQGMAIGGPDDPPSKNSVVEDNKQWLKEWFKSPETLARYSMNTGKGFTESVPDLKSATDNIDNTTYKLNVPTSNKNAGAMYRHGNVNFYKDPNDENSVHEFTHASKLDDTLSNVIKDKWGTPAKAIQDKTGLEFKDAIGKEFNIKRGTFFGDEKINSVINHSRYMSEPGELYPRIMEMRRILGAKPGQIIKDEDIDYIEKNIQNNDMFKFYTKKQIKDMLNTLALNDNPDKYNDLT